MSMLTYSQSILQARATTEVRMVLALGTGNYLFLRHYVRSIHPHDTEQEDIRLHHRRKGAARNRPKYLPLRIRVQEDEQHYVSRDVGDVRRETKGRAQGQVAEGRSKVQEASTTRDLEL